MRVITWVFILLLPACNIPKGTYVLNRTLAGESLEFLDHNKYIHRVGHCGGGSSENRGTYKLSNDTIAFVDEIINDHFTFQLTKINNNVNKLSLEVHVSDAFTNEKLQGLTVRIIDGINDIDALITDSLGSVDFKRLRINGSIKIKICDVYFSDAYVEITDPGDYVLGVKFIEKNKNQLEYTWAPPEYYKLIKLSRDSLIYSDFELGHSYIYHKKNNP